MFGRLTKAANQLRKAASDVVQVANREAGRTPVPPPAPSKTKPGYEAFAGQPAPALPPSAPPPSTDHIWKQVKAVEEEQALLLRTYASAGGNASQLEKDAAAAGSAAADAWVANAQADFLRKHGGGAVEIDKRVDHYKFQIMLLRALTPDGMNADTFEAEATPDQIRARAQRALAAGKEFAAIEASSALLSAKAAFAHVDSLFKP